jgi:hypothetical protein
VLYLLLGIDVLPRMVPPVLIHLGIGFLLDVACRHLVEFKLLLQLDEFRNYENQ